MSVDKVKIGEVVRSLLKRLNVEAVVNTSVLLVCSSSVHCAVSHSWISPAECG